MGKTHMKTLRDGRAIELFSYYYIIFIIQVHKQQIIQVVFI